MLKGDLQSLVELIDESAFDTESKEQMKASIQKIAKAKFQEEQNRLADSLKV
jgi:hypothetical protein